MRTRYFNFPFKKTEYFKPYKGQKTRLFAVFLCPKILALIQRFFLEIKEFKVNSLPDRVIFNRSNVIRQFGVGSLWFEIGCGLRLATSLWTSTSSRSINTQKKNEANIQPS